MKVKGLRWYIVSLIGIATIINYIDRSAINIMWPYIYKDFGISDAGSKQALAYITTFFMVAYAIGQSITGKMMDAIGTRIGFVISIVGWSVSIALHAIAKTIASFTIFRFFLGLFEAGNWPGATKSNAEWFPVKERAIAQGIFGAGASLGGVVAAPFIAGLYIAFGWQATFAGIAILGIIWIIPWLWINKATPDKHPWITEAEQSHILYLPPPLQGGDEQLLNEGSNNPSNHPLPGEAGVGITPEIQVYTWSQLLQFKRTWSIILSRFFIDPVWWLFVTWLPTFLKEQFQFDIKQVGAFAWVPFLFAALGGLLGGFYSSWLVRKGKNAAAARKLAILVGCIIMLLSLIAIVFALNNLKNEPSIAIALISTTLFGFQFLINNLQTLPSDYFNGKNVGTVAGMGGTSAVIGTLITTLSVPVLTQTSYVSFFVLAAVLVPLSYISLIIFSDKKVIQT